jgi:hypothetical protein
MLSPRLAEGNFTSRWHEFEQFVFHDMLKATSLVDGTNCKNLYRNISCALVNFQANRLPEANLSEGRRFQFLNGGGDKPNIW